MDNFKVYLFAIAYLLSSCFYKLILSMDSGNSLRKKFIESSNNENLSFTTLSTDDHDPQDTNETWRVTNFEIRNITTLLSEYPLITHSLPAKNSSRYFCTKRSTASLTLSMKSFKHGVMFLNFSYFIGRTQASEPQEINDTISDENLSALPNSMDIIETETTTELNLSSQQSNSITVMEKAPSPKITLKTLESELNHSPVSISISSLPNYEEGEVPELLKTPETHRKRRSVILETVSKGTSSMPTVDDSPGNETKLEELMTTDKTDNLDSNGSISSPSLTVTSSSNNVTNAIDALTLVQAVEMIKTAAAAISKGTVVSAGPLPDTSAANNSDEIVNSVISNAGSNLDLSLTTEKSTLIELPASQESTDYPKVVSTSINEIKESESTEIEMTHHHHHKSKNGSNKSMKSENKKRRNRGKKSKKVDSVERSEKDGDSNNDDNDHDTKSSSRSTSSSSSSSSSEEEIHEHAERKPKISYKMWRASLEKKNRPPGLYVTVNDDIIFDNWEGIWDKQFVLGKWTGSKALVTEDWNQTSMFMNWDAEATGRDLKITFEWEPVDDYELLLADIEISTMISPEIPPCNSPPQLWSNEGESNNDQLGQIETQENLSSILDASNEIENQTSIIVLKQSKTGKKGWEIVRAGMAQPSTWGKIDNLELHQLPESNQAKLGAQGTTSPEDILHAILERLHTDIHSDITPQNIPTTENVSVLETEIKENFPFADQIIELEINPNILEVNLSSVSTRITTESSTTEMPTNVAPTLNITVDSMTSNASFVHSVESSTSNTTVNEETTTLAPATTMLSEVTAASNSPNLSTDSSSFVPSNFVTQTNTFSENLSTQPVSKALPIRKTDKETALLVSVLTGSIALVILVLIVKKRMDISSKGRNANR